MVRVTATVMAHSCLY